MMMIEEHGIPNGVGKIGKKEDPNCIGKIEDNEDPESIGKVEKGPGTYREELALRTEILRKTGRKTAQACQWTMYTLVSTTL
jgi:hypothetical protein